MKALLLPLGEIGHVNPLIGLCQRLVTEGHTVAVHSSKHFSAQFARAGVEAQWSGEVPDAGSPPQEMAERMRDPRWLARWYGRALAMSRSAVTSIAETVRSFQPDVMAVDPLNIAAAIVAERERVPWAGISTNFVALRPPAWGCQFVDVGASLLPPKIQPLLVEHGVTLRFDATDAISPWFNSVFTTERFAPRPLGNHHSTYVGPPRIAGARGDEPAFPWERLDARPIVYVSSGGGHSLGFDASQLLRIAGAIDLAIAQLIIAAPSLHADAAFRAALPASAIVVPYAPQRELLARARIAVTHGGVNSVNECLGVGCPMLVLALGREQPLQAELVSRAGAGLALDVLDVSDRDSRDAFSRLLAGECHAAAAAIRDDYDATDSTDALYTALTTLARRRRSGYSGGPIDTSM
jgi:MGT family glycosyltransferase